MPFCPLSEAQPSVLPSITRLQEQMIASLHKESHSPGTNACHVDLGQAQNVEMVLGDMG